MTMTQKELYDLAARYDKKAESALERYHESGMQRHLREYENAGDMAEAFRVAAGAASEHEQLGHIKGTMSQFVNQAVDIRHVITDQDKKAAAVDRLLDDLIAYGKGHGVDVDGRYFHTSK